MLPIINFETRPPPLKARRTAVMIPPWPAFYTALGTAFGPVRHSSNSVDPLEIQLCRFAATALCCRG